MAILNTNSTQDASLVTGESFDFLMGRRGQQPQAWLGP